MLSKQALAALAIAVTLIASASSARAEEWRFSGRDAWNNYRVGDYFKNLGNKNWEEVIGGKSLWKYQEAERTADYIHLYDASRELQILIYANGRTMIEYPGSNGFFYMAPGTYIPDPVRNDPPELVEDPDPVPAR